MHMFIKAMWKLVYKMYISMREYAVSKTFI